jgi:glutamate/tyrosine decarboxylase-like PLP-dependent enzyme
MRNQDALHETFDASGIYLQDNKTIEADAVNYHDVGFQLSRNFRALKIWLTLSYYGMTEIRAAIHRTLDLARKAEEHVMATPDLELLAERSLGIVCFRFNPGGLDEPELDRVNEQALRDLVASGYAFMSSTRVGDRFSSRMCVLSHRTVESDVRSTFDRFVEHARNVLNA